MHLNKFDLNLLIALDACDVAHGVIAFSSGNHAQGVAWAAALHGVPAVILMPVDAPAVKIAAKIVGREPKAVAAALQKVVDAHVGGDPGNRAKQLLGQAKAGSK